MNKRKDTSLDSLFKMEYDEENCNCLHLFCAAWKLWQGDDLSDLLAGLLTSTQNRYLSYKTRHYFEPIKNPETPCMIEMESKGQAPHVGFYHNGFVMQMTQQGVQNQPLEISTRGYKKINYYRKKV